MPLDRSGFQAPSAKVRVGPISGQKSTYPLPQRYPHIVPTGPSAFDGAVPDSPLKNIINTYNPDDGISNFRLISRLQLQANGSLAIAPSVTGVPRTVGFLIPLTVPRTQIIIKRYTVSYYELSPISGQMFFLTPVSAAVIIPGTDADGNLFAVGEYSQGSFGSRFQGAVGNIGQTLGNSATSCSIRDDLYDSQPLANVNPVNKNTIPASITVLGSALIFNADASPHTVRWREMINYEVWLGQT